MRGREAEGREREDEVYEAYEVESGTCSNTGTIIASGGGVDA